MTPRSAADYYRRQQRIIVPLLLALRRAWRRMDPAGRWEGQYEQDGIGAQLLMLVSAAQVAAARDADGYIAAVLAELELVDAPTTPVVVPSMFAGVAGDGRSAETLLSLAVPRAGQLFNERRSVLQEAPPAERPEWMTAVLWESLERARAGRAADAAARVTEVAARAALADAERWIEQVAATMVIDAARAAESAAITAHRQVGGYVRMLNPPSCSRCAILAGKFYRWNAGFERHPLCDCRHIPVSEDQADDLRTHPDQYFDSLTRAEQDRIFTKAGAQAIRDGADMNQVVNARRGMKQAQVYGHDVLVTSEGTTRRGIAFETLSTRGTRRSAEELATRITRAGPELRRVHRRRANAPRLMPESIYELAGGDRDEAIRLLRAHGFIHRYQ